VDLALNFVRSNFGKSKLEGEEFGKLSAASTSSEQNSPESSHSKPKKGIPRSRLIRSFHPRPQRTLTELDHEIIISQWEHYAILSLMETEDFHDDFYWIGSRLNISPTVVRDAVERLIRAGLVKDSGAFLVPAQLGLRTSQDIPCTALREGHKSTLERASVALNRVPVEDRCFSSSTMAIRKDRLPQAKKLIAEFQRKMNELLEETPQTEVYELAIQLFPVSTGPHLPKEEK
jgi:uncharacterized protein (TIGR02147 family)